MAEKRARLYDVEDMYIAGENILSNPEFLAMEGIETLFERILRAIQIQCDPFSNNDGRADYGFVEAYSPFAIGTNLDDSENEIPSVITGGAFFSGFLHNITAINFLELKNSKAQGRRNAWSEGIYLEVGNKPITIFHGDIIDDSLSRFYLPLPEAVLFLPTNSN